MADGLHIEIHGNVGMVIMDRPPHNFLNFRQIHDIADALGEMENDMSIRCAVLAMEWAEETKKWLAATRRSRSTKAQVVYSM